jgi:hypothetical protein
MMERARDELARRAEAQHPGWSLRHGIYGWPVSALATASPDGLPHCPGLHPLMTTADELICDPQ